jgi:pimeloyl-ACP methyl ester carboxylesterase
VKLAWKSDAKAAAEPEIVDGGKLEGNWQGTVPVGAAQIRVILRFAKTASGSITGSFSSPDQGAGELALSVIASMNNSLQFMIPAIAASFTGTMSADGTTINGTLTQGISQPVVLKKTDRVSAPNRPQEPKKPFPYIEEEVQFVNAAGGVRLAGTLTRPQCQAPLSCRDSHSGSGAQDRDETILGHKPFLVLSDYLTRRGTAVLRVDDRGVGGSTGNMATATTADFAGDVLASIQFLKRQEGKSTLGYRIGSATAKADSSRPIVASQSSDVAFVVMLAGSGLPGEDILYAQAALIAKKSGASEVEVESQRKVQAELLRDSEIRRRSKDSGAQAARARKSGSLSDLVAWFRYFLTYDPRPALAKN